MSERRERTIGTTADSSCSEQSLALGEDLAGTATHAVSWLLIEHPGPWGAKAPRDVRWPEGLADALVTTTDRLGIRLGLIRRPTGAPDDAAPRRPATRGTEVLLAHTGEPQPWLQGVTLADATEALDLDLPALAAGVAPAGTEARSTTFLVCTHSGRDLCCARKGRPVAAALAARFPERTWETTHLGGHRFAATFVAFPHGLMFGRVPTDDAVAIADAYLAGEVDPDHYRGRTCWPGPVQAAEAWVREQTGIRALDAVTVRSHHEVGSLTEVELTVGSGPDGRRRQVDVETDEALPARQVSCAKPATESPPSYRVRQRPRQDAR